MRSDSVAILSPDRETMPIPFSTKEEDDEYATSTTEALLPFNKDDLSLNYSQKSPSRPTILIISLVFTTCIAISAAIAFGSLFFSVSDRSTSSSSSIAPSTDSASNVEYSRSLTKLKHPVVLLISSDGFRFGYQYKTDVPSINRLIKNGTAAELGLIPVFPTLTFPNHYSIVTGLYPSYHGIINNYFTDPETGDYFNMASHEPKWWLGEPLWETVVNHGLKASTYFWPGSEVHKGSWNCPKDYCMFYNKSVPFEERVDTVLRYFDLPSSEIPSFMTLYFEDPDNQGHKVGPDDPQITEAIVEVDKLIGKLILGLEQRGVFEDVNIILLGDHGMAGTCDKKLIFLDDLVKWIEIPKEWVQSYSPLLAIRPPPGYSSKDVVAKMNEGLKSGNVENGQYLTVYLKEELPSRLHYSSSYRIPPIVGLIAEGFKVEQKRSKKQECGGAHGYDNEFFSMRTIFFAHGPRFARGRNVPSFENVEIYNLVTTILDIQGAPNNGSVMFPQGVLLPSR
ncbi:uncharacterized protein [Primulina eburnea]|uniref:uncharacterized protein n=1 Tax=Primulina eburnea TaxID=1245227 RepID=UPI003C6BEA63